MFLDFNYDPLRDGEDKIIGIMVFAVDVTSQVFAKKSVERANAALEIEKRNFHKLFSLTNGLMAVLTGPDHRFEFVNSVHIRLLGKTQFRVAS